MVEEHLKPKSPTTQGATSRSPAPGDTSVNHFNSTFINSNATASTLQPNVSPVKPISDDESEHGEDEPERISSEFDKTLSDTCTALDNTVLSLKSDLLKASQKQSTDLSKMQSQLDRLVTKPNGSDSKLTKDLCDRVTQIEKDIAQIKSDSASIKKLCCDIKSLVTGINPIKADVSKLLTLSVDNADNKPQEKTTFAAAAADEEKPTAGNGTSKAGTSHTKPKTSTESSDPAHSLPTKIPPTKTVAVHRG